MRNRQLTRGLPNRSRPKLAPWLAILALFIQFVAGFGHFHPEDLRGDAPERAALLDTVASAAPAHGDHAPELPTRDDCPICIVLNLAGSATLPAAPMLVVPTTGAATAPRPLADLHISWPPYFLFASRGPPHA